ncbi:LuxR family transcriptional regulator [Phyllobacterium phragmitis]|uniref:LuxR family transcriptional regulator n=1 Tax=Phyllobacterium phragmitis TaxID=2670329 RepID=A0A2S9IT91_9HYPH|nr:LuxR family transcriptional regulator [Phyllobacterium phragmitis]
MEQPNDSRFVSIDRIAEAPGVQDALWAFQGHYEGISFVTYQLARTVAGKVDAPFVRTTYPESWIARYLLRGYVEVDPIVRDGFARRLPFHWHEVALDSDAANFLADASAHGVGGQGYSIPVVDKVRRRGLFSVNSVLPADLWKALVELHKQEWASLAQIVHGKAIYELHGEADPVPALSRREVECLHWTALGKDLKDIALILNLSDHTVRDYLKSARLKLGCATRSAAATRAIHLGIITPWPRQSPPNKGP